MRKNNKKGFTIVELVIVIAVIAILAAVLIPTYASVTEKAKTSAALQQVRNAYLQAQIMLSSAGLSFEDGAVFSDSEQTYFFALKNGTLEKTDTLSEEEKDYFTELENGVRLYGCKVEETDETGTDSSNKVIKLSPQSGNITGLTIYGTNGSWYYRYSGADATEGTTTKSSFVLTLYNAMGTSSYSGAHPSMIGTFSTTAAADAQSAIGWYGYELKTADKTYTGVFYYDGATVSSTSKDPE